MWDEHAISCSMQCSLQRAVSPCAPIGNHGNQIDDLACYPSLTGLHIERQKCWHRNVFRLLTRFPKISYLRYHHLFALALLLCIQIIIEFG